MYMKCTWPTPEDPTPPIFHWLALGVWRRVTQKKKSANAKYTNMLVYFALGNAKCWRRGHCPMPAPDARYFAFWWNIGFNVVTLHSQVVYTFSKQLWGLHSPSTCLVPNFQIFTGDNFVYTNTLHICFKVHSPYSCLVYTLQAHVRFKILKFSREFIFFHTYTLHACFRIHSAYSYSPSTC